MHRPGRYVSFSAVEKSSIRKRVMLTEYGPKYINIIPIVIIMVSRGADALKYL